MKTTKNIILLLAFFSFVGCKTTKLEKLEVRSDSTIKVHTTTERPPILDKINIYNLCDTTTARPVQFKRQFIVKRDTITVEVKDNDLLLSIDLANEIISKQDSIIKISDIKLKQEQTIVKTKAPKWAWFTLILSVILLIFPNINKFTNNLIRKIWIK